MRIVHHGVGSAFTTAALAIGLVSLFGTGVPIAYAATDVTDADSTAIEIEASNYDYNQGSLGFFESIGATNAVNAIKNSPNESKVGAYQNLGNMDSTDNAFNLDNMKKSLDIMEECNSLRRQNGLSDLKVDPLLVAQGQIDANYSKGIIASGGGLQHASIYNIGENLAGGYSQPFAGWYDQEKAIWDSPEFAAVRQYYESQTGVNALYNLSKQYPAQYQQVGHYLNIVNTHYRYTGAAWAGNVSEQSFGFSSSGDTTYTVDEFTNLFNAYYEKATQNTPGDQDETTSYNVLVQQLTHGTIVTDKSQAQAGETVNVTVNPEEGYEVTTVNVLDSTTGESLAPTKTGNNTWSFTMPDEDVTVQATTTQVKTYTVTKGTVEHAAISCDVTNAKSGDTVIVTVTPDEGWTVEAVRARVDGTSTYYAAAPNGNNTWSFYMPAGSVTLTATLAQADADDPDEDEGSGDGQEGGWSCDGGTSCPTHSFADVEHGGSWYHQAVDWAVENGVMSGYSGTSTPTFGPNDPLNRAQMATILYNLAGKPSANPSLVSQFSDCAASDWYATAVAWSVSTGAFTGYSDSMFGPLDNITREQMAVVLWRQAGQPNGTGNLAAFSDGSSVSSWARDAMSWAVGEGLIQGYTGTTKLDPGNNLTRAQAATIIMRWTGNEA